MSLTDNSPSKSVAAVVEVASLSGRAVRVGRDHSDSDRHRCLEQVHHLLVCQGAHRMFADLHQATALPQPSLPGVPKILHLCNIIVIKSPLIFLSSTDLLSAHRAGRGSRVVPAGCA